jgi:thymidine kinase
MPDDLRNKLGEIKCKNLEAIIKEIFGDFILDPAEFLDRLLILQAETSDADDIEFLIAHTLDLFRKNKQLWSAFLVTNPHDARAQPRLCDICGNEATCHITEKSDTPDEVRTRQFCEVHYEEYLTSFQ